MITKRSISKPNSIEEFGEIAISKKKRSFSFSCSRPLSSSQTTTHPDRTRPAAHKADGVPPGASGKPHATKRRGWRSGNPKAYPYHSPDPQGNPRAHDLFHTSTPTREPGNIPDAWATRRTPDRRPEKLHRKEVIQPHLPVRLPCYDLVPITSLTLDGSPPQKGWATGFGCYPLS